MQKTIKEKASALIMTVKQLHKGESYELRGRRSVYAWVEQISNTAHLPEKMKTEAHPTEDWCIVFSFEAATCEKAETTLYIGTFHVKTKAERKVFDATFNIYVNMLKQMGTDVITTA